MSFKIDFVPFEKDSTLKGKILLSTGPFLEGVLCGGNQTESKKVTSFVSQK